LNKFGRSEFARCGAGRCGHICQLVEKLSESRQPILHGRDLRVAEGDLLPHALEIGFTFEQVSTR
jgi:hypothetical protein